MKTLRSSWNSDRIAACSKVSSSRVYTPRKRYLFAQYKGNEVSVMGARGKKYLTVSFNSPIISAMVKDEKLYVETKDQSTYIYNAISGQLISENHPNPPSGIVYSMAA